MLGLGLGPGKPVLVLGPDWKLCWYLGWKPGVGAGTVGICRGEEGQPEVQVETQRTIDPEVTGSNSLWPACYGTFTPSQQAPGNYYQ